MTFICFELTSFNVKTLKKKKTRLMIHRKLMEILQCTQSLSSMCTLLLACSRFKDVISHLQASGCCYQHSGDSWNLRRSWDIWFLASSCNVVILRIQLPCKIKYLLVTLDSVNMLNPYTHVLLKFLFLKGEQLFLVTVAML